MFADGGFMVRSLFRKTNSKPFKASMAQQERPITLWCFCLGMESRGVLYSGSSSYSSTTTIIEDKRCPLLGSLFGRGDCSTHEQRFRLIVQLPAGHNEQTCSHKMVRMARTGISRKLWVANGPRGRHW